MQGYGFVTLLTQLQSRVPSHTCTCTCTPAIFHKNTINFSLDQVLVAVPPELSCYILTLTFLMAYIQKLFIYKCIRVSCDTFTYNGHGTYQTIRRRAAWCVGGSLSYLFCITALIYYGSAKLAKVTANYAFTSYQILYLYMYMYMYVHMHVHVHW